MSKIKILQDLPQGELPQREERLRKTGYLILCSLTFLQGRIHREKKDEEKKRKMFLIKGHQDLPQGELLRGEERLRKNFFDQKKHKKAFLSLSSLCVIYPGGRPVRIKTKKVFFIFLLSVEALLEAVPKEFSFGAFYVFFSQSFFSLWKYFLRQILMNLISEIF